MKHTIEVTARYKMGHQVLYAKTTIIGRNINQIEEVPVELPEYADGCLSRVWVAGGNSFMVTDPYDKLVEAWKETLDTL